MSKINNDPEHHDRFQNFPTLASLRLEQVHWEALSRQGFVAEERRGHRTYFKLRFRSEGKQVVRYVGDEQHAARVRAELEVLQQKTKALRELNARVKRAGKILRDTKRALEPVLEAHGFQFHGYAIRRPRTQRTTPPLTDR